MSAPVPFSKKDGRKITPFVGQELLYDYLCNKLDPERTKAISELVTQSAETQSEIQTLKSAIAYVELIRGTSVAASLVEKIKEPTSYLQGFLGKIKFGTWPAGIKLGFEVLIVSTLVFTVIIAIPWNRVATLRVGRTGAITLVEIENNHNKLAFPETELIAKEVDPRAKEAETFLDEGAATKDSVAINTLVNVPKISPSPIPSVTVTASPTLEIKPEAKSVAKTVPMTAAKPEAKPQTIAEAKSEVKVPATQGYLYRGSISVTNLNTTTEKFVEKINGFGGRRAGDVELGWKKDNGSYFHFTIPEAKYDSLVAYLNEYGKLKISKEKHERLMPDGIIRLIISVSEEKKKAN